MELLTSVNPVMVLAELIVPVAVTLPPVARLPPVIVLDAVMVELLTSSEPVIVFELLNLPSTKTTPVVPEAVLGSSVNILLDALVEIVLESIVIAPILALAAATVPPPLPIGPV